VGLFSLKKKLWYVFFFQGEASPGLSDGDCQRSPQDRTKTHGRLDHQQRQVHHKRANKRTQLKLKGRNLGRVCKSKLEHAFVYAMQSHT
jgi:hypothetical protein